MLADDGYVFCRGLFSAAQSRTFGNVVENALGVINLSPDIGEACAYAQFPKLPRLWPLLRTEGLVDTLTREMGTNPVLLSGVDTIAVNAGETQWHRDASYDGVPSAQGPDDPRYRVTRLITYPGNFGEAANEFRVLPGSHRHPGVGDTGSESAVVRLALVPGDAVLFDARIMHAGAPPAGVKRLITLTFGGDDVLTVETMNHEYRNMRKQGLDPTPPRRFEEMLAELGLLAKIAA